MKHAFVLLLLVLATGSACSQGDERERSAPVGTGERWASNATVDTPAASAPDCRDPDWAGPWTACPEASWVRRVATDAGYRIINETGSALIARGGGDSFYIWATHRRRGREGGADAWPREIGNVRGVTIRGDEDSWRWWPVHGMVVWLHAYSSAPDVDELGPLVEASERLPPPR